MEGAADAADTSACIEASSEPALHSSPKMTSEAVTLPSKSGSSSRLLYVEKHLR